MRKRAAIFFLIFLILSSGIAPVLSVTDEGYGEDHESLDQFVDSFEDTGNVSVAVDVVNNATAGWMELNSSGPSGAWLPGWPYRKEVVITGSSDGAVTEYQVPVKVYYGDGVDGTETVNGIPMGKVYLDSKCDTDFGNIRWTGSDEETEVDYWIETFTDSVSSIFWIEADAFPADPDTSKLYIYYGKEGESTTSNGADTFLMFVQDDLTDCDIINNEDYYASPSTASDGTVTIVGGKISITIGGTDNRGIYFVPKSGTTETRTVTEYDNDAAGGNNWEYVGLTTQDDRLDGYFVHNRVDWIYYRAPFWIGNPALSVGTTWGIRRDDAPRYYVWENGVAVDGNTVDEEFGGGDEYIFKVGIWVPGGGSGGTHTYNWIRTRKYVSPPPVFTSWGEEEEGGGYSESGYFTTTDYLDYANGSILVLMTNTTIPEGTVITVEFSEDNATWALNDWEPIAGGFESIDLRELNWSSSCYLRYNFTGGAQDTPRLYQSRLITTGTGIEAPSNGDIVVQETDYPWVAIAIILMCVAFLLVWGSRET